MHRTLFISALCITFLFTGCTAKAKLERHVKRADTYFEKGDFEKARIEYMNAYRLDPKDSHVAARLGEAFLQDGDFPNAYRLLSQAVSQQATNIEARVKLASVFLLGGDPIKAREHALEVLKQSPLHPDGLLVYANSSVGTNEIAGARTRFESLAAANPQNAAIQLGLGTLAQRANQPDIAEAAFKKAIELDPKSAKNNLALGSFYFLTGNTNKAGVHLKTAMDLSPLKSVERLGFAEFQMKVGRMEAAEATLNEATAKHPDFIPAWNMLTQLAFAQRNTNTAGTYIAKALARAPQDRDARLNHARLKLASSDYKGGIAELERLTKDFPRDSQAHVQLAMAQVGANDPKQAVITLNNAITANPNNVDAHLLRARLQIAQGEWNSAIPELNQLLRRFPDVPQAYYLLGSAHRVRGNLDDAATVFTEITRRFPADPQAFQILGTVLREQNKLPQARKAFEDALKANPDFLAAIDSLTELDIAAKQFDSAIKRINVYSEKYPKSPLPPLLLGKIYFQQEKNDEAEAAVLKAIALEPEYTPAHRSLADFYVRTKQTDKAIAKLESIVAREKNDIGSWIQLGMLMDAKGDYQRALQSYESVIKLNPNSMVALNNIAYLLSERLGQVDRALEFARRARNLAPTDPFAGDTFGWIMWKKGQYVEALAALQQSAERLGNEPEVQYHLGMAQYMLGDAASATVSLTKAAQSTNDFLGKDIASDALTILKINPEKSSPEAIAAVERHISRNPNDLFAQVQLARLHKANRDFPKSLEVYERVLAKNPKSPLVLSGIAALYAQDLKQPARAMEYARQAWAASPTPATAALLGPVAYDAGDFKWANGRLIEALRVQSSPELLYYKGLSSFALAYVSQAVDELDRAAGSSGFDKQKATLATAGSELAKFHLTKSSPDAAQRSLDAALAIDPHFPPALIARGLIAEQNQDFPGARIAYESALKQFPNLIIAQRQLAILLGEKLPDDARAHQLASALRQDLPDDPAISKVLGKIAYRRGDYREAAQLLNTAAARQPNDSDLLYHLGMAQYRLKDSSAKGSLTKAISLEPNNTLSADAKKALAELK
jgi:tetratricopeptide (TPR) repeat protein